MNRSSVNNILFLSLSSATLLAQESKPNVVFIVVDDLAYDAIESSGRYPFLKTPNINRIQNEGVTFNNFFCTMSLSSPSRACFLTGMYPHKHGVTQNHDKVDANWEKYPSYTHYLQQAGYETAFIGKIHQASLKGKDQVRPGFDYWLGFRGQGHYVKNVFNENGVEFNKDGYITDVLTDYSENWLLEKRNKNKPFNLCLWHKGVHGPFQPAPRHLGIFANDTLPIPPNGNGVDSFAGKPDWQILKKKHYKIWDKDPQWNPKFKEPINILETLTAIDESVGRIYKLLEKTNQLDNTMIIFTSDNGYFMGEHGYWDKRISYEESMRIPMIIRYPAKIKAGSKIDKMCLNVDVAPTILQLLGLEIPQQMQGKSMMPLFENENKAKWRKQFMFEYFVDDAFPYAGPTQLALRTERYKLVDNNLKNDIDELYDLQQDPGEMNNLINNPDFKNKVSEMRKELEKEKKSLEFNEDRDFWLRTQVPLWDAKYKSKNLKNNSNQHE